MNDRPPYDFRNCTSLFGYSAAVHVRSGGSCELCDAGDSSDFDWWRQLTVEHLIGEGQGGEPGRRWLASFPSPVRQDRENPRARRRSALRTPRAVLLTPPEMLPRRMLPPKAH
jgi:hypothetical protein